jgi:DNA-directed RNA polymerase specialized sigma24 family protein
MPNTDVARVTAFYTLGRQQQREAITRLAVLGMSEHAIASATHLSVEMVRSLLGSSGSFQISMPKMGNGNQ